MTTNNKITDTFTDQVVFYLKTTPQAIAVLFVAFFVGHLWIYIITAYIRTKTKGDKLLQSYTGRVALGLIWLSASLIPVYALKYGDWPSDYMKILDVTVPTLILGLFAQLIIFALFVKFGD